MSDDRRVTWERYVGSWQVTAPAEKLAIFETCLSPACVYRDPLVEARGWAELLRYMVEFHERVPGGHFVTERFFAHHGRSLAIWKMMDGDAVQIGDGMSFAEYDDASRLVTMTGFFETSASRA